ncbi:MAG TPA: trypsin-like peptidase domain-containing protein [Bryobacteraceae bacterium]|nr:trypsin-like peptidase domain-containing protein [Bryobacteraceae bacterium]
MNSYLRSIVPFFRRAARNQFLGTGIVVAPRTVLTCAHVFASSKDPDFLDKTFDTTFGADDLFSAREVCIVDGSRTYEPLRICCRQVPDQPGEPVFFGDFCCVHFDQFPELIPARLGTTRSLAGRKLRAAGFTSELLGPAARLIPDMEIVQGEHNAYTNAIQYVQVSGGLPEGFSGGAVFSGNKSPVVVGMLQTGRRTSATSRFIAVDALLEFLASQCPGIILRECGDDIAGERPSGPHKLPYRVHQTVQTGDIRGSRVVIKQVAKEQG